MIQLDAKKKRVICFVQHIPNLLYLPGVALRFLHSSFLLQLQLIGISYIFNQVFSFTYKQFVLLISNEIIEAYIIEYLFFSYICKSQCFKLYHSSDIVVGEDCKRQLAFWSYIIKLITRVVRIIKTIVLFVTYELVTICLVSQ